jgi:alginate O-acetyltransferase complex protein AlgJ
MAVTAAVNPVLRHGAKGDLADGSLTHAFGADFDNALWIKAPSVDAWAVASYGLFKEGRDGVVVGADEWLFSKEEFAAPDLDGGIARAIATAKAAQTAARAHGAQFIVVVVPAKARMYRDKLGRYRWPPALNPAYDRFVAGLRGEGVPVVDLQPALAAARDARPTYLRTDTHWTPWGAQVAAGAVAAQVKALGLSSELPGAEISTISFEPEADHVGDLINFLPLGPLGQALAPRPDRLSKPVLQLAPASGDLLGADLLGGDDHTPVLLVGTSYSADERWGFAAFLEHALQAGIVNEAEKGKGPYAPLAKVLAGGDFAASRPSLVIWEFPERDLWTPHTDKGNPKP